MPSLFHAPAAALAALVFAGACCATPQPPPPQPPPQAQQPPPQASGLAVGYPSVADALAGVSALPGVSVATQNDWTVVTDPAARTVWSFAPASYRAYPAVVKRQIVVDRSGTSTLMGVLCEAPREACEEMVRAAEAMDRATAGR